MKRTLRYAAAGLGLAFGAGAASAQVTFTPDKYAALSTPSTLHGQVNVSGATLFEDFFRFPASTNDFIDADANGDSGSTNMVIQNLAVPWYPDPTFWLVNYRGVGSVNGLKEFLDYQGCGTIPSAAPSTGWIHGNHYSTSGTPAVSPLVQYDISLAVLDVPSIWATRKGDALQEAWNAKPLDSGYGECTKTTDVGFTYKLEKFSRDCDGLPGDEVQFNANIASPDDNTLYDSQVAWVPIAYVANRGTGMENVKITELQHLFVTGRLPNGENLVASTRTPGSGTRNGAMNSIGVDPSQGVGDNVGTEKIGSVNFQLSPIAIQTNCEGSGDIETVIQNWRLALGYTGLGGDSRAAGDTKVGRTRYEILNVMFDDRGGSLYIRPTIGSVLDNLLDNADATKGYQVGGPETFVSRGDPYATNPADPEYMENQAAADYLKNILESVEAFVTAPANAQNVGMPGEYLATTFFLIAGMDALPTLADPTNFVAQVPPAFNAALQTYIRANNGLGIGGDTPAYGLSPAGLVPVRNQNPDFNGDMVADKYSDGSGIGTNAYCYCDGSTQKTLGSGLQLGSRNEVSGDFDANGLRNLDDADELVAAYYNPRGWSVGSVGACVTGLAAEKGAQTVNTVIAEVVGDFNGDGDFSKEDLRYFMDGLAIDSGGQLDRKAGAIAIDNAILTYAPTVDELGNPVTRAQHLPWADTRKRIIDPPAVICGNPVHLLPAPISGFLSTGAAYAAGDFRGDVAGNTATPGAKPSGWDGVVDCADVAYVYANFGDWSDIDQAYDFDLTADMNGDLVVDITDVQELVTVILKAAPGDGNLDGVVNASDNPAVLSSGGATGEAGTWCTGDYNFDGVVNAADVAIWQGGPAPTILTAQSVKTHNLAGTFGVNLLATPAIECRNNGPTQIVVTYSEAMKAADGSLDAGDEVTASTGTIGAVSLTGAVLTINLTGVADKSCLTVDVSGMASLATSAAAAPATFKVTTLNGDAQANSSVNIFDLLQVRSKLNLPVDASNFRNDIDAGGAINIFDLLAVRSKLNNTVACP